ncbi:hypothetical protein LTR04_004692, partial [Oleoguttula sp. CCFEE 6159]
TPFLPHITERFYHNAEMLKDDLALNERKARAKEEASRDSPLRPFGGKPLTTNRSAVLLQPTIWSVDWQTAPPGMPRKEVAQWPSRAEREHEGDQRAREPRKRFHRYLGAPRAPDNTTDKWGELFTVRAYPLDEVNRFPCGAAVMNGEEDWFWMTHDVQVVDEADAPALLGAALLRALDEPCLRSRSDK